MVVERDQFIVGGVAFEVHLDIDVGRENGKDRVDGGYGRRVADEQIAGRQFLGNRETLGTQRNDGKGHTRFGPGRPVTCGSRRLMQDDVNRESA